MKQILLRRTYSHIKYFNITLELKDLLGSFIIDFSLDNLTSILESKTHAKKNADIS